MKRVFLRLDSNSATLSWLFYHSLKNMNKRDLVERLTNSSKVGFSVRRWEFPDLYWFSVSKDPLSAGNCPSVNKYFLLILYLERSRLIFSKAICWASLSSRECRAASVIFLQLAQSVEKCKIVYFEKLRLIDFNELNVWRVWIMLCNAPSVCLLQLLMIEIWIVRIVYEEQRRLIFWREVGVSRDWLKSWKTAPVTSWQLSIV